MPRPGHRVPAGLLLTVALLTACGTDVGTGAGTAQPGSQPPPAAGASPSATPGTTPSTGAPPSPSGGTSAQVVALEYRAGAVTGVPGRVEVPLGSDVVLRVTSDVADELHLHGYDEKADLRAGVPGELRFRADIPGIFELELEQVGKKLTRLQVR